MKRFLLFLSFAQFCLLFTYCSNQSAPIATSPTSPTTSDTICFESEILPLLRFNCASAGCHEASSASKGVIMEDFTTISAQVTANNLDQSALYNIIKSGTHQGVVFDQKQIELIQNWILQGATNTVNCSGIAFACDTTRFTYSQDIRIILDKECVGCHNASITNGNIRLDAYAEVKKVVDGGLLPGVIEWQSGFSQMPQNRDQLPLCERTVIRKWIEAGMPEN